MPAGMAGIQVRRMRPETSMSAWIPALHAGMTESRSRTKTDRGPPPLVFSKEDTSTKFMIKNIRTLRVSRRLIRPLAEPFRDLTSW